MYKILLERLEIIFISLLLDTPYQYGSGSKRVKSMQTHNTARKRPCINISKQLKCIREAKYLNVQLSNVKNT
jgi:hypothetical protein